VSEVAARTLETDAHAVAGRPRPRRVQLGLRVGLVVAAALVPIILGAFDPSTQNFWLQLGVFAFSAMVAALGLTLLVGGAGQLSLAHSFFVAIGAYGYTYFAAPTVEKGTTIASAIQGGFGLPTVLALVLATLVAGLAGLLFSPISSRLRGIYLGVASLGLVFVGVHIEFNAQKLSGGFNGRDVPDFNLFGFQFDNSPVDFLGVTLTRNGKLWYLGLAAALVA